MQNLVAEFFEKTKNQSYEQIIQERISWVQSQEASEPETAWRRFSHALHFRNGDEIENLILEHTEAAILWSGTNCPGVEILLNHFGEEYFMSRISESGDEGEATFITPFYGPIVMKKIEGNWKIDASKLIEHCKV
ncbi:MAG: hypothetical protein JXB10_08090 [Pirellulales bacterium]|nr:hypothetical protein [Pirellulales bacterium]